VLGAQQSGVEEREVPAGRPPGSGPPFALIAYANQMMLFTYPSG
jgi:hypothetical protein